MTDRGLSARTVRYTHVVLRAAMRQALHCDQSRFIARMQVTSAGPEKRAGIADLPILQLGFGFYSADYIRSSITTVGYPSVSANLISFPSCRMRKSKVSPFVSLSVPVQLGFTV